MSKDDNRINPYPIRLPQTLRKRLEAVAKANGRSLNAEMLLRLDASFEIEHENTSLSADDVKQIALEVVRTELARSDDKQ